jgi:hypothetical protein
MVQVLEHFPSKLKAPSSNTSTTKFNKENYIRQSESTQGRYEDR